MAQVILPVGILPPLQRDDAGDWVPVNKLSISDSQVSGKARSNVLNQPTLYLDRTTGSIALTGGLGDFAGQCELFDKDAKPLF